MKVYILYRDVCYGDQAFLGVYSTLALAMKAAEATVAKQVSPEEWISTIPRIWTNSARNITIAIYAEEMDKE